MKRLLAVLTAGVMVGLAVLTSGRDRGLSPEAGQVSLPLALGAIHPRISPDGRTIAVSYQGAIWTVPAEGGTLTRLTDGAGFDHEPAWSPDGTRIAFVRGPNQTGGELHLIQAADGKEVPLPRPVQVRGVFNFHKLEFDPTGRRILGVLRSEGTDHGLAWYDLQEGGVKPLAVPLSSYGRQTLSPDGQWVIYSNNQNRQGEQAGNDGPQADLWKVSANGGQPERIVRFPSHVHDLCFHADGKSLIVVSELGGAHYDLWQLPLSNPLPGLKHWTSGQADEDRPSISRDGKRLVYTDNRSGATALIVRDLGTGQEHTVVVRRLDYRCPTGTLRFRTTDRDTKKPLVARIALQQEQGKFFAPPGALYRFLRGTGHFYAEQTAELVLPAGKYRLRAFRGPEYRPVSEELTIQPGQTLERTVELARWTHAAQSGWYSGENHIHANYGYGQWYNTPESMLLQCQGEDLNVCNFMVANSDCDGIFDRSFFRGRPDPRSTAETILYWNQEFRSTVWGHMTLVNLRQVVEPVMTGFRDTTNPWDIPTNSDIADRAHWQKGHVNYTHAISNPDKPFDNPYAAKGLPIDLALGKIDSLDLNNAYSGTVPIWHRLLNCGFRLPPSAGTDCFLNRIFSQLPGGDRVYVKVDGPLTYAGWIDGLKKGRSFVSNGPMLELTLDSQSPSSVIKLDGPRKLMVKARARSQFPLARVELIYNGQVAATLPLAGDDLSATLEQALDVGKSGWLALRASGPGNPNSSIQALFAHTAPVYVEIAGAPFRSRADAQYFLKWIDDLALVVRGRDRVPNAELRQHIEAQFDAARAIYARIAREGM
jgi:Tol biopolymer transport system component